MRLKQEPGTGRTVSRRQKTHGSVERMRVIRAYFSRGSRSPRQRGRAFWAGQWSVDGLIGEALSQSPWSRESDNMERLQDKIHQLPAARWRAYLLAGLLTCWALGAIPDASADRLIALNPGGTNSNVLDITLHPFSATLLGPSGVRSLSGLDFQPGTGVLFASSGTQGSGRLFTLDTTNGTATLIGSTGFAAVPGLSFGPGGRLYGSADVAGGEANGLILLHPATGQGTLVGLYGSIGQTVVDDISGLAFNARTGILYGSTGPAFDGTPGDLVSIHPTTGQATLLGSLTEAGTGALLPVALTGIAFDSLGQLYGALGGGDGRILAIDLPTLTFHFLGDAAAGSISAIAFQPTSAVPEPTTLSLLGLGLLGVSLDRWRQRRRGVHRA